MSRCPRGRWLTAAVLPPGGKIRAPTLASLSLGWGLQGAPGRTWLPVPTHAAPPPRLPAETQVQILRTESRVQAFGRRLLSKQSCSQVRLPPAC